MRKLRILMIFAAFSSLAVGTGILFAALGDTQSASGSITVSSTSADLYICEPGNVAGPACGPDDNADDEAIFENLEDLRPGQVVSWDIRLKNVGTVPFDVVNADLQIDETSDPGQDCPDSSIRSYDKFGLADSGISILGKAGDGANDNTSSNYELPFWRAENGNGNQYNIHIVPGDYEDIRLRVGLQFSGTIDCDGNTWDVAWTFEVE